MANVIRRQTPAAKLWRGVLYAVLVIAALFYVLPLVVMLMTSIKPLSEISAGTLLSLPQNPTLEPWAKAWGAMAQIQAASAASSPGTSASSRARYPKSQSAPDPSSPLAREPNRTSSSNPEFDRATAAAASSASVASGRGMPPMVDRGI